MDGVYEFSGKRCVWIKEMSMGEGDGCG